MNIHKDISPEEFEILEQYILRQMPVAEQEAFTSRLEGDTILQQKLHSVKLLLLGVQEAALTKKIEQYHLELPDSEKKISASQTKIFSMKKWLAAASVIIIATVGALLYFNSSPSGSKLFAAYYKPDTGLISAMSVSDNYVFDRAMIDYKTGDYTKAIASWETLLKADPVNDTLNYFLGSAYLAKDNSTKALDYFQKVTALQDSYFFKDACWYTGLALLKNNKKKEAILFIEKSNHPDKEALLLKLKEK